MATVLKITPPDSSNPLYVECAGPRYAQILIEYAIRHGYVLRDSGDYEVISTINPLTFRLMVQRDEIEREQEEK